MATKVINDPIHGNIELKPLLVQIIDTPQFQRLRNLKQLGGTYFVYPGASHNRFEHSIGVCHLAGRLVKALKSKISESLKTKGIQITLKDELCVEIAALCHDLGHGPFSHLFDGHIIKQTRPDKKKWKHEKGSIDMLDHMLEENKELKAEFDKMEINDEKEDEKNLTFIKEMIYGPLDGSKKDGPVWNFKGRTEEKRFLYEIVSNGRNGIDVDKWDYFARDSYMLGIGNNFNYERCIDFSRVIEVDGESQICYREKEATNLYDMFHTRLLLHQRAYQHKTGNIIEHMIAEALVEANELITFKGKDGKDVHLSETVDDMKAYTLLTDHVFHRVLEMDEVERDSDNEETRTKKKKIKKSKDILTNILKRDLYKCVGEKRFPSGSFTDKEAVKSDIKEAGKPEFEKIDDYGIIDVVKLNYGKGNENPLDHVNFYAKNNQDQARKKKKDDVSLLLPKVFEEQVVRVYWKEKNTDYRGVKRAFEDWAEKSYAEKQKKCEDEITVPEKTEQQQQEQKQQGQQKQQ